MCINIEQDLVNQYDHVAEPFFSKVLGMDFGDCIITDESELSDFTMTNLPDEAVPPQATHCEVRQIWDSYVTRRIQECFGIEVSSTVIRLVDLFQSIEESSHPRVLH